MAYEESRTIISRAMSSTSDLSTRQYRFVTCQADGDLALQTTAGGWCLGVTQDAISTASDVGPVPVCIAGVSKIWYASSTGSTASIAYGDLLQSHTTGEAIIATTSDRVIGLALTAHSSAAARALGEMLVFHAGIY